MPNQVYFVHPYHQFFGPGPGPGVGAGATLVTLLIPLLLVAAAIACMRGRNTVVRTPTRTRGSTTIRPRNAPVAPVRASDLEREATARVISHAVGEGRLSIDEGSERIDAILSARHRHELANLVSDLPQLAAPSSPRPVAGTRTALLVAAAATLGAAIVVQATTGLWELWPLAVLALAAYGLTSAN